MKLRACFALGAIVTLGVSLAGCQGASLGDCGEGEDVCGGGCADLMTSRANCGECGNVCGDGFVCEAGTCTTDPGGCGSGMASCGDTCVDVTSDPDNCGGCGATNPDYVCGTGEVCSASACTCAAPALTCGTACVNPMTDNTYCGASGTCTGASAGVTCGANQACLNGTCQSTLIYRGSLPATTGRWQFNAQLGINGANSLCAQRWPGSAICTYDKLLAASLRTPSELLNATDFNNVAVTTWWVDDSAVVGEGRCTSNQDAIPWTYQTADQGHVGKYVDLTPATGAVSMFLTGTAPNCSISRNVACCSIVTAP